MRRISRWFTYFETWVIIILIALVIGFGLLQIILRNFFSTGLVWGDAFMRHTVLWICLLGAARAAAEDKHINIDLLPRLLSERSHSIIKITMKILLSIICAILVYSSIEFVKNERLAGDMAFASIPLWWLDLIFPFSFTVMSA